MLNPYDPFIAKKIINVKHIFVVWNVDDFKVRHKSKKIFARARKWLKKTYERLFEGVSGNMNISKGNIHYYLGITLDFSEPEEVYIIMIPINEDMVKDFAKHDYNMKTPATPESDHLLKTREYEIVLEDI